MYYKADFACIHTSTKQSWKSIRRRAGAVVGSWLKACVTTCVTTASAVGQFLEL